MKRTLLLFSLLLLASSQLLPAAERKTAVSIVGEHFHLNGTPTYAGREWRGPKIEGLLMISRMLQGIFDDRITAITWASGWPCSTALAPTQCHELKVNLSAPDGTTIERSLHGTIHQLSDK